MKLAKLCTATMLVTLITSASAQAGMIFGSAETFAVLGGSTVTNTGSTVVTGNLGVWPGSALTGFPPGIVNGQIHLNDAVAQQAMSDANTAYNGLASRAPTQDLTGTDLGGLTLTPGVYFFSSSAFLTSTLTLDAQGDPNAEFVFQMGSTLITASNSSIITINGVNNCNIYWQVGSSATLGTNTAFIGSIVAQTSITLNTDASITDGRAFALNGAVTMDSNMIDLGPCVPSPGAAALFLSACFASGFTRRRLA
ncbi:MAG: DUF3494 domain-containing protein [Phycisphaerales bacterium]|nr:DUF3494 domain-containing protein [Phycisphaerales bacterium]